MEHQQIGTMLAGVSVLVASVAASLFWLRDSLLIDLIGNLLAKNQMLQTLLASGIIGLLSMGAVFVGRNVLQALRGRLWTSITIANRDDIFDKVIDFVGKNGLVEEGSLTAHTARKKKTWKDWRQEFLMGQRHPDSTEYRAANNNQVHVLKYKGSRIIMHRSKGETIVAG